ncbi:MAG: 3-oxoacyl-ACP reductase FabG [Oscillibacter sp.]|nr:3-oxoacyl-ACP reductase FabG [Oscillibacter sp.]
MGKTAFVTGGSRGIGRAIVRQLSAEGYAVGINYLQSREQAEDLAAEIQQQGGEALAAQADVADRAAVTAAIREVEAALGPIDLLVNNAGIAQNDLFQDTPEELWRRMFAVHADGAFHTIQAVLPHMLHEKAGCIVNISSIWGLRGASCEVAYAASKAAVIGLTRSLAMELAPSHIRVNCIAPGVIRTDMVEGLGEETIASLVDQTPAGRLGTPEDIAKAVAFLAREDADFITGQVLTVDGGFIL